MLALRCGFALGVANVTGFRIIKMFGYFRELLGRG